MRAVFAWIDRVVETCVALIFVAMAFVGLLQVFNRFVLNASLSWSEEVQIFGHIWLVFLAIPIAYQRSAHIQVEAIRRQYATWVGAWASSAFEILIELLWIAFAIALAYLSYRVSLVAALQESPGLEIPMSYPYYGMVIGGLYLLFVVARRLVDRFSGKREPA